MTTYPLGRISSCHEPSPGGQGVELHRSITKLGGATRANSPVRTRHLSVAHVVDAPARIHRINHPRAGAASRASRLLLIGVDVAAVGATMLATRSGSPWVVGYWAFVLLLLCLSGTYETRIALHALNQAPVLARRLSVPILAALAGRAWLQVDGSVVAQAALTLPVLVSARLLSYGALRHARRRRRLLEPALIIGSGEVAVDIARRLRQHREYGLVPVGFVDSVPVEAEAELPLPLLGPVDQLDLVLNDFDVTVGVSLLVLLGPLLATIAVAVRLGGPGPIIFRQRRIGQYGRQFELLKFRSMRVSHDGASSWSAVPEDQTAVGRWLRSTSLDELPQLWNVVRGDMSLVGPRPERPHFAQRFTAEIGGPDGRRPLAAKHQPGRAAAVVERGARGHVAGRTATRAPPFRAAVHRRDPRLRRSPPGGGRHHRLGAGSRPAWRPDLTPRPRPLRQLLHRALVALAGRGRDRTHDRDHRPRRRRRSRGAVRAARHRGRVSALALTRRVHDPVEERSRLTGVARR